jgi:chitin disaccharide deacetylase
MSSGADVPTLKSSELLGYPPDARVLIVNCDDFGMHDGINAAVMDSIGQGAWPTAGARTSSI